jgi:hypothetical protein
VPRVYDLEQFPILKIYPFKNSTHYFFEKQRKRIEARRPIMICNHCRANNADDANFCQQCGRQPGTTGLDEPTFLSSPPVYASAYGSTSSLRDAYDLMESGTPPPPPPPVVLASTPPPPGAQTAGKATAYEEHPPLQARRQKNRRRGWIVLSCLGLLVLLAAAVGSYMYSNRSTPGKTLAAVCNAFKAADFPTVYNQYSSSYQRQIGGEASWEAATKQDASSQGGVVDCSYSGVNTNGSAATDTMSLTFGSGYGAVETFQQTLIVENGVWKINSSRRLT